MSQRHARIIEKDIISDLQPTQGGDGEIVDLFGSSGGCEKLSCQFVYDVLSFSPVGVSSAAAIFDKTDPDHPSQFLDNDHGLITGLKVQISTNNALPDPLVALTDYFVIKIDDDYFSLAASLSDALNGIEIELNDVGAGSQTITAVALAGASIKLQKSNDKVNWIDVAAATSITADGTVMVEPSQVSFRYVKAVKAITAGAADVKALLLVIGDSI